MGWWTISGLAIGGAFLLEGMMWALFPQQMREMMRQALQLPDSVVQTVGIVAFLIGGAVIVMVAQGAGG